MLTIPTKPRWLLLLSLLLFFTISACGSSGASIANRPDEVLVGRWTGNFGLMEFYNGGTVRSQNQLALFTGDYKLLDDTHIRIDWKEQGAFGHQPTQIFTFRVEGGTLFMTNDTTGETNQYTRAMTTAEQQRTVTVPAEQGQASTTPATIHPIVSKWRDDSQNQIYEFFKDGRYALATIGTTYMEDGRYIILDRNRIEVQFYSPSGTPTKRTLEYTISGNTLELVSDGQITKLVRVESSTNTIITPEAVQTQQPPRSGKPLILGKWSSGEGDTTYEFFDNRKMIYTELGTAIMGTYIISSSDRLEIDIPAQEAGGIQIPATKQTVTFSISGDKLTLSANQQAETLFRVQR